MAESYLATDAASGAVVLSGSTNAGQGGVYVQRIVPSLGPRVVLGPLGKEWGNQISGRIGAPGVYVAYADGQTVRLYRYGGRSKTVARGPYPSATVCAGPAGRLWVAWGGSDGSVVVTRSTRAASAFEPEQKLQLPGGALSVSSSARARRDRPTCRGRSAERRLLARARPGTTRAACAGDEDEGDDLRPRRR